MTHRADGKQRPQSSDFTKGQTPVVKVPPPVTEERGATPIPKTPPPSQKKD